MKEKINEKVLAEYLCYHENSISKKYINNFVWQAKNRSEKMGGSKSMLLKFTERALAGDFLFFQKFIKDIQDIKNCVNDNKKYDK